MQMIDTLLLYVLLPLQFVLMTLSPGLWIARGFRLGPVDRLILGIALSWIAHYLIGTVGHLTGHPQIGLGVALGLTVLGLVPSARALQGICRQRFARNIVLGTVLVTVWGLLLMHTVMIFSGAAWAGDWIEHYERARYFSGDPKFPAQYEFIDRYLLPARPPLQNVATALVTMPHGGRFDAYLIAMTLLNSLVASAALAQLSLFSRRASTCVWIGVALLMLNPMLAVNLTYAWTKCLAAFYALVGFRMYLHAVKRGRFTDWIACSLAFSAGCLGHYSIGPYVVVLFLDLLTRVRRHPWMLLRAGVGALAATSLGMTWFAWSIACYGWRGTFASNSSVTDNAGATVTNLLGTIGHNLLVSVIPSQFIYEGRFASTWLGNMRDFGFLLYQQNLLALLGLGGIVALILSANWYLKRRRPQFKRASAYVLLMSIVGIAVVGGRQLTGQAHLCLIAMILQGVMLVAASMRRLRRDPIVYLITLLYLVDLVWGIVIHFVIQAAPWTGKLDPNIHQLNNAMLVVRIMEGRTFPADMLPYAVRIGFVVLAAVLAAGLYVVALAQMRRRPATHQ